MKFALNGTLIIGTLDGANIEIREEIGAENFFLFGLTAEDIIQLRTQGYNPWSYYNSYPELRQAIDRIASGYFSPDDSERFKPIVESLLIKDEYMVLADYPSYITCQEQVSDAYCNAEQWTRMSILSVAQVGKFSSDRTIREYCQDIWNAEPVSIELGDYQPNMRNIRLGRQAVMKRMTKQ